MPFYLDASTMLNSRREDCVHSIATLFGLTRTEPSEVTLFVSTSDRMQPIAVRRVDNKGSIERWFNRRQEALRRRMSSSDVDRYLGDACCQLRPDVAGSDQGGPTGKESNWIPTVAGKEWEIMMRFYGPKPPLFDKTWVLPDVVEVAAP